MREPAERAEPVARGHDHDLLLGGEQARVGLRHRADQIAAAVNPEHHRQALLRGLRRGHRRRVHVEVEAVLLAVDACNPGLVLAALGLDAARRSYERLAHARQGAALRGAFQRNAPRGGCANGSA